MKWLYIIGGLVFAGGGAGPAWALTWEKSSQAITLPAGASETVIEFPFKNEGASAVTITELKSNCGCAEPTVAERVVQPDSTGVVKVTYVPGDRVGPQSAQLTVTTDEKDTKPASLQLRVNIEPAVTLLPRLVRWTKGDTAERIIEIKQAGANPVRVLDAKPVSGALAAELKPGEVAGHWRLVLTPKNPDTASTTKVDVRVETGGRVTTYTVFGVVR